MPSSARKNPSAKPAAAPRSAEPKRSARNSRGMPLAPPVPPIDATDALPAGSAVGGFLLRALVERDDFSLRYRASVSAAEAEVLIEEYWPAALVERGPEGEVVLRDASHAAIFEAGLAAFVDEATQLAQLDHPALGKIGPVWRLHGTACRRRVEPLGRGLLREMEERARPPDERWLRALADPLLGAIDAVHRAGLLHGNVRPGNIVLRPDESPVLLDFGAAPAAIARLAPWRAPPPEPAFAAPELQLYGSVPGPSADLYSLAAVLWFLSTGELPGKPSASPLTEPRWDAVLRRHPSLRYSSSWMEAVDAALAFDAQARPQSVEALRRLLAARSPTPTVASPVRSVPPRPAAPLADAASWADPSWSGLEIQAPSPGGGDRSHPSGPPDPFELAPPMRADDGREPTWQFGEFVFTVVEASRTEPTSAAPLRSTARTDDRPWPTSGPGLLDAPLGAPAAQASPARPPTAAKSRHWPWAVGGAMAGGLVMLLFGLGWGRISVDPSMEQFAHAARNVITNDPIAFARPSDAAAPPAATDATVASRSLTPPTRGRVSDADLPSPAADGPGSSTVLPARPAEPRVAETSEPEPTRKSSAVRGGLAVAEADPATACAPRTNFSLYLCMKTQCERAAWYAHPQCIQLRREDER